MSQRVIYRTSVDFRSETTMKAAIAAFQAEDPELQANTDRQGNIHMFSRTKYGSIRLQKKAGEYLPMISEMDSGTSRDMVDRLGIHYKSIGMQGILQKHRYMKTTVPTALGLRIAARSY